jgi:zinc protease
VLVPVRRHAIKQFISIGDTWPCIEDGVSDFWEAAVPHRCLAILLGSLLAASPVFAQEPAPSDGPAIESTAIARPAEIRIADRVILIRDERMQQTHFTLVVHAGCLDEEPTCRGIAHYLEHLLLSGRNPDHTETAFRFFADGYANGWTTQKATAFVHRIAPRPAGTGGPMADLERLFAFYANRLRSFEVSAADAVRERNVVLQEYQLRIGNSPFGRFGVQYETTLLPSHPHGRPVIGSPETIQALTVEEAQHFHARWYVPNNATVVVAGNLDPEAVRTLAARTLGTVEPRSLPPRSGRDVPEIERGRLSLVINNAQVKRRIVRYAKLVQVPEEVEDLLSARLLLANFLSSQLAGSPNDVLVEQLGLTDGIAAGVTRHLPGLYRVWLSAEPVPETSPDQLAEAMRRYLDGLTGRGFDPATLERLKRRFAADVATASLSGERIMDRVVNWIANDDPYDDMAGFPLRVAATTPGDMARLLTALAGPGRELTGFLLPETNTDRRVP